MKKLIVLSAIATLTSGAAFAENLNVGGAVSSVCAVSNINTTQFFQTLTNGATKNVGFDLQCNDADGATMSLTTSEGHLQNADQENQGVGYTAMLTADAFNFTLSAENGQNDQTESQSQPGSSTLAAGGVTGNILLTVTQEPVYAGTYADTLMLAITAN
ncbi:MULTISPECIES: hypothetical protein [Pseudoalteromonas]|uniref:Spore coat protein U domain-containing protein n=2 Tax=Pseudoalteromonas arctica TaxID=394751 RepID=A0A290S106_9GAMM|nr:MULTISPECIES: hypothetical protein [Pseudoalteromonas]ATC85828.1 hypothetical protein PARC_a1184 [Pseudoalteromonas arctica A 37-1-2]MBH0004362.1 hypothetical protein [Pseudoalteromonas sp. SWYJZ12]MBH0062714.1 hypothetical protein [Pseudoalteromonas sp. NZS71]MDN3383958.1 hypothetical protein [Pseudoalteromonas sp. APC 3358]NMP03312.1 hypothetical protein [Pseudoalteromonas arctica]